MTDATTPAHGQRLDSLGQQTLGQAIPAHSHVARIGAAERPSLLDVSAGARLLGVVPLLVLLWAGVFWALH